jgi:diguanylate cyclase (GGDEF)-like protein
LALGLQFDTGDRFAISQLVLESNDEIIFKTDRDGFVCEATPAIAQLGFRLVEMLIGPHVSDMADEPSRPAVQAAFVRAMAGQGPADWVEFRAPSSGMDRRWFAMRFAPLKYGQGDTCGVLGIARSRGEARLLEEQLFRAELTDPLTGLTNRRAWMDMIAHLSETAAPSSLALIEIDFFKAINLHHGLAAGDGFLVDFADFLRTLSPPDVSISRVGTSRFGLLFPGWSGERARAVCREIVEVLASLRCSDWQGRFTITASVGLTPVTSNVDQTVKAAESALRLARAKGGNTVAGAT